MDQPPRRNDLLHELETRQDEVLRQLDDLNARLESLLAECAPLRTVAAATKAAA